MPKSPQIPTIGRIVMYVPPTHGIMSVGVLIGNPEKLPAIIVEIPDPKQYNLNGDYVNLQVFCIGTDGVQHRNDVTYSEEKRPDSWHWPEFVRPAS